MEVVETDIVTWPVDFIPATNNPKPTLQDPLPMESRFKHMKCFDRRIGEDRETDSQGIKWDDFQPRLSELRTATVKWGSARVEQIFIKNLNDKFHYVRDPSKVNSYECSLDLRSQKLLLNGRSLRCLSDFTAFIRAGPWDNRMRDVVHYAQDGMWDVSNTWAVALEEEYTKMLGIRFSGERADPNNVPKRITQGNCAHYLFVKSKGTLVSTIRNTTRRVWREAIFVRRPIKDKQENFPSTTHKEKGSKIPKILHYDNVLRCTDGEGYFGGVIGYCEGHPHLVKPAVVQTISSKAVPCTEDDDTTLSSAPTPHPLVHPGDPRASRQRVTHNRSDDSPSTNSATTRSTTTTGCTSRADTDRLALLDAFMEANPDWTPADYKQFRESLDIPALNQRHTVSVSSQPIVSVPVPVHIVTVPPQAVGEDIGPIAGLVDIGPIAGLVAVVAPMIPVLVVVKKTVSMVFLCLSSSWVVPLTNSLKLINS
jgi:hypothetical protein